MPLDVLVEVDAQEHAEDAQQADLEAESQREFEKDEVDRQRRADAGCKVCGKHILNGALRGHDPEDLS